MHNLNKPKLNKSQSQAVEAGKGQFLIIAGAGTGKTTVIVERIKRLLSSGVTPQKLLALTFTEKAATEMLDRVSAVMHDYQLSTGIMTFNAFGESLLRQWGVEIGLGRDFKLIGEAGQLVFLKERIEELRLDYFAPVAQPYGQLANLINYFSRLKQNVITPDAYKKFVEVLPAKNVVDELEKKKQLELANAYEAYIRLCRQANVIDYDDQIYLLIELLNKRPNVLRQIQKSFDYIMVDEFQDTNRMQSVLIDMIAGPKPNLFVVGDDDQSIYGWRGATLDNILGFKDRYPDAKQITLIDNYRSSQKILDSAYKLIQFNNPDRLEKQLKINKRLLGRKGGKSPQAYSFESYEAELSWVANDIKERLKAGTHPSDIAVLARRNLTVSDIHQQFEFSKIAHNVIGQPYDLYQQPVVRSLLAVIKAVADPLDNINLFHSLSGPLFSLSPHELSILAAEARTSHKSLSDVISESNKTKFKDALDQIKAWRQKSGRLSVGQLSLEIINDTGFRERLYQAALNDTGAATDLSRLSELFSLMKQFEQVAIVPSAAAYINDLAALVAASENITDETLDLSEEAVNVLSIHQAKGLEWPIVYIVDVSEGSFPLKQIAHGLDLPAGLIKVKSTLANEHIAEERRLMYVAMTRSKDGLILTSSRHHSPTSIRRQSRFLNEIFGNDGVKLQSEAKQVSNRLPASLSSNTNQPVKIPASILSGNQVNLSVSQVKMYLDCPLDFYYCYILNIPTEQSAETIYGSLMHQVLESINQGLFKGKLPQLKTLQKKLQDSWPAHGFLTLKQRELMLNRAQITLRRFYEQAKSNPRSPIAVEEPFKVHFDFGLSLRGRFDAVFQTEKGVEIVDYKTSLSVDNETKAKQRASSSQQLTLYALAWQQLHDEIPALVSLDFIDNNIKGSLKKTQKGLDGAYSRLEQVANGIRNHDFKPGKQHRYCKHPQV